MTKFTNTAPGARGILLKDGTTQIIEAGATVDRDTKLIASVHPDITEGEGLAPLVGGEPLKGVLTEEAAEALVAAARTEVAEQAQAHIDKLKSGHADEITALTTRATEAETALAAANDEITALKAAAQAEADKPKPVALSGKNKEQLLEVATAEGVTIEEGATNADIVSAIELHREASATA